MVVDWAQRGASERAPNPAAPALPRTDHLRWDGRDTARAQKERRSIYRSRKLPAAEQPTRPRATDRCGGSMRKGRWEGEAREREGWLGWLTSGRVVVVGGRVATVSVGHIVGGSKGDIVGRSTVVLVLAIGHGGNWYERSRGEGHTGKGEGEERVLAKRETPRELKRKAGEGPWVN